MSIEPNSYEFNLFFTLTIVVLAAKLLLALYLAKKILDKKKETGKISFDFIFSVFVMMLCLFISRLFFTYFDFFLTKFDESKYWKMPNIIYWKIASFISTLGFLIVLFIVDKTVLNFKFKGVLSYLMLIINIVQLLYPVNSAKDFEFVSSLSYISLGIGAIIPLIFLYIGIKTPGLRNISFLIVSAIIIYVIGGLLVGENILEPLRKTFGPQIHITVFFIFLISKIVGLCLLTYAVSKFSL